MRGHAQGVGAAGCARSRERGRACGSLSIPGRMSRLSAPSSGGRPPSPLAPPPVSGEETPARAPLAARSSAEVLKNETVFIFRSET